MAPIRPSWLSRPTQALALTCERARAFDQVESQPRWDRRCAHRARGRRAAPPRSQAAVVQGPRPGRPALPGAAVADQVREPAYGLPGGGVPEYRRVLEAWDGHVHDPRRYLHPPLRLLQRQDRKADLG